MPRIIDIAPDLSAPIGFVHACLGAGSCCAQIFGHGRDTNAAQVEAISVPTGQHSCIALGHPIAVVHTGKVKQIHFIIGSIKVSALEADGQRSAACAMAIVHMFIESEGVVKISEQLHHMAIGSCLLRQHQAVGPNARPVGDAVVAPPVDLEPLAQVIQQGSAIKDTQENLSKSFPMVPRSRLIT